VKHNGWTGIISVRAGVLPKPACQSGDRGAGRPAGRRGRRAGSGTTDPFGMLPCCFPDAGSCAVRGRGVTRYSTGDDRRPARHADVAQWQSPSLPSWSCGFDSRHPLQQISGVFQIISRHVAELACDRTANRGTTVTHGQDGTPLDMHSRSSPDPRPELSKLVMRIRFPSPAPFRSCRDSGAEPAYQMRIRAAGSSHSSSAGPTSNAV
jgi:hypothetical protein